MSKPMKNLIVESYKKRFGDVEDVVLISIRGVEANDNNTMRWELAQKGCKIAVIKNSLVKTAVKGTALEPMTDLLDGPCALAYGGESLVDLVRDLIAKAKDLANLEFRGAVMGGEVFGPDQIDALSKYPTLDEARGQTVQLFLSPAGNLAGSIGSPASKLAGSIKTIEEKLETGETIAKV